MRTILVVEDSPSNRHPMARLLRSEGFETFCSCNGDEALRALEFVKPDLVLLDLMMPVMDGIEFLKILRQDPTWANLPVIAVTAKHLDDETVQAARLLGAKECLRKASYTPDQLFTSIRRNLAA